ncbi:triphosphoribosyl-dephospho-CoA synthase [Hathewaya proteolytica DSM 3090]|uniref:Probable 2-(5''-triphosphoribosyl)-3'-dephosphocoenzyme-A synthase n=1 Tax=Hathewaya proteolytica DSM 3090 TaxID=1121331 RepID=A0A1M6RFZ2_9CLOT|nr:triphosphoribosyl-dephospho-CoA synthase CitG [Hathewaya proteolytica]SHK31277.1 triphosphoribosyl-dephospho-CoA synthase [Hathewaya proteolytica DSM 3090]
MTISMKMGKEDVVKNLGKFSLKSMLYEVSCYPSPGLVSPISNGAHKDMDHFTFLDSVAAIGAYLYKFAERGFNEEEPKEIFQQIRNIGLEAEKAMMDCTKGVNTYKGMIFLMGISLAATAKAIFNGEDFEQIPSIIASMTEGIVEKELASKVNVDNNSTYGERIYKKYGIPGVRGEVQCGLSIIFERTLSYYEEKEYLDEQERLVQTLVYIMSICDDTNILHRHDIDKLQYVKSMASGALELGGMETIEGRDAINDMDFKFSRDGISPGGSADLLAVTIFFSLVKKYMKRMS